jgi:methylthioribose-1-phosphate isomerase
MDKQAMEMNSIEWLDNKLKILDQSKLPREIIFIDLANYQAVSQAIKKLRIRGAPAIGIAAAYGIALGAQQIESSNIEIYLTQLNQVMQTLAATRPTAVNLFRAINRMKQISVQFSEIPELKKRLIEEAKQLHREEIEASRKLSQLGAILIEDGFNVLTHCNAGPLATAGYGTALGIIITASKQGKKIRVIATETRPLLQGSRLTTWELVQASIPVTLITDSMAGYIMNLKKVDCVIVGADRIAANGDVANKIGTYSLAVLAKENNIPFYVAAPESTIDFTIASGEEIQIEERDPQEVTHFHGIPITVDGIEVRNFAFDITPHTYISKIITERGIIEKPFTTNLASY